MSFIGAKGNPIDILNVDYDDVLHLYRGWRRSEDTLKEKDKELQVLRARVQYLEDNHIKFRAQVQALESVRELTISLQSQLSVMQQENFQLTMENKELTASNERAQEKIQEQTQSIDVLSQKLREYQENLEAVTTDFQQLSASSKLNETTIMNEQARRTSADIRLKVAEETTEELRKENKSLKSKLEVMTAKVQQCDLELAQASNQLKNLSVDIDNFSTVKEKESLLEAQNVLLRGDISRLIRLLEYYPATKDFLRQWQDSEGMSFIGTTSATEKRMDFNHPVTKSVTSKGISSNKEDSKRKKSLSNRSSLSISRSSSFQHTLGLSTRVDDVDDVDEDDENRKEVDLSVADLLQLRSAYGDDPFPMSATITVIRNIYTYYIYILVCNDNIIIILIQ